MGAMHDWLRLEPRVAVVDARVGLRPGDLHRAVRIVAVVNMDAAGNDYSVYRDIVAACNDWARRYGVTGLRFVPIAARSADIDWYDGPALAELVAALPVPEFA